MADATLALKVNSLDVPAAWGAGQALQQRDQQIGINNQTMQLNDQRIDEGEINKASLALDLDSKTKTHDLDIRTKIADQYAKLSDDSKKEATNHLDLLNAAARSVSAVKDGPERVSVWNRELDRLLANGAITKEQYSAHKQAGPSDDLLNHVIDVTETARSAIGGTGYGSSTTAALMPNMADIPEADRPRATSLARILADPRTPAAARAEAKSQLDGMMAHSTTAPLKGTDVLSIERLVQGYQNQNPKATPDQIENYRATVEASVRSGLPQSARIGSATPSSGGRRLTGGQPDPGDVALTPPTGAPIGDPRPGATAISPPSASALPPPSATAAAPPTSVSPNLLPDQASMDRVYGRGGSISPPQSGSNYALDRRRTNADAQAAEAARPAPATESAPTRSITPPAPASTPPPAAANPKLNGSSEEDVIAFARDKVRRDPRLLAAYKKRLQDLGIDPGKL